MKKPIKKNDKKYINTGTPFRIKPNLKLCFSKLVEFFNEVEKAFCCVPNCQRKPLIYGYCIPCWEASVYFGLRKPTKEELQKYSELIDY